MSAAEGRGPLDGLVVVDLSTSLASAYVSMVLADFGAEVIQVEPEDGSPLRDLSGWPFWGRGKQSVALDLSQPSGRDAAARLIRTADIVVESFRPNVADRLQLGYERSRADNPGLIWTSISGFGRAPEFAHLKGYEAIALAKLGALGGKSPTGRQGPSMPTSPVSTLTAALLAVEGTLVALYEREASGCGQRVDTSLVQGFLSHDSWSWLGREIARRMPDAFQEQQLHDPPRGVPGNALAFGVMGGLSADGRWLQFALAQPKQFEAFLHAVGLGWTRDHSKWRNAEGSDDVDVREQFWDMVLKAVRAMTVAELQAKFDADSRIFAELFRHGAEVLDHPQMVHDEQVVVVDDPKLGPVRQPGVLIKMSRTPGRVAASAPNLDSYGDRLPDHARRPKASTRAGEPPTSPALTGVTVLELGTFFAGPWGTTMLADLGARVIKVEPITGDPMRRLASLPEMSAVRVTQGKESISLDLEHPDSREVLEALVGKSDIVLQTFRAAAARKLGVDHESLMAMNPDLIYHYGQGYGFDGPYSDRPAYAPVISAASGFVRRNLPTWPEGPELTHKDVRFWALRGQAGLNVGVSIDHFAGLGVAIGMALGLLARRRGLGTQFTMSSMLQTTAHMVAEDAIGYAGRPDAPLVDDEYLGFHALYRLYEASDGWVVVCAESQREWENFAELISGEGFAIGEDARFSTASMRRAHDQELIEVVSAIMLTKPAAQWEKCFTDIDVACAQVHPGPPHSAMDEGGLAHRAGMVRTVEHPIFGEHTRTTALVNLSRSEEVLGAGVLNGQNTDEILRELGFDDQRINQLRDHGAVDG